MKHNSYTYFLFSLDVYIIALLQFICLSYATCIKCNLAVRTCRNKYMKFPEGIKICIFHDLITSHAINSFSISSPLPLPHILPASLFTYYL